MSEVALICPIFCGSRGHAQFDPERGQVDVHGFFGDGSGLDIKDRNAEQTDGLSGLLQGWIKNGRTEGASLGAGEDPRAGQGRYLSLGSSRNRCP